MRRGYVASRTEEVKRAAVARTVGGGVDDVRDARTSLAFAPRP